MAKIPLNITIVVLILFLSNCSEDKFPKEKFIKSWKIQQARIFEKDNKTIKKRDLSKKDIIWDMKADGVFDLIVDSKTISSGTWEWEDGVKEAEGTYQYKLVKLTLDSVTKNMRLQVLEDTTMTLIQEVKKRTWKQYPSILLMTL